MEFIEFIKVTSFGRTEILKKDISLWRSQIGHNGFSWYGYGEEAEWLPRPFSKPRMKPRENRALEGRVNAKGIPCLYLSTDEETSLAEVRPWLMDFVTVARFRLVRSVSVVDCTRDKRVGHRARVYGCEEFPNEPDVWESINRAFTAPVQRDDDLAEYVATQILSEAFRECEFDGIRYNSGLGKGMNVTLFDMDLASCRERSVHRITKIEPPGNRRVSGPHPLRKKA
jgi:hypothetical protein